MTEELKLKLRQLKSKNNKTKSKYIQLSDSNHGRKRSLVTFTVKKHANPQSQLLLIKKIKSYFSKRLQNLKSDIQYFNMIELGKNYNNPHLHSQLFFNEEDTKRVEHAFNKTIEHFSLNSKRCKLVKESEVILHTSSYNYIIKNLDNLQLTNKEILELDAARKRLKQGETKHLQLFSMSRSQYPHPMYKALLFQYGMKYINVNNLMNGYATRLQGLKLLEARQINELPYILFKDGAIRINSAKLYDLMLLTLLYIRAFSKRSSEKIQYINKWKVIRKLIKNINLSYIYYTNINYSTRLKETLLIISMSQEFNCDSNL